MAKKTKVLKLTAAQKRALADVQQLMTRADRLKIDPNRVREWFKLFLEIFAFFKGLK